MEYEIVALVVAICTLLLFAISFLSIKGQSYEEAVAANRKLIVAQRGLLEDPVKQKRLQQQQTKKNKKAGKKVKEKQAKEQAAASSSEIESNTADSGQEEESSASRGHVEFTEPAIIVTPEEIKPPKNKKKSKDAKVKPILINKDDPSCISDVSTPPSPTETEPANHFEQIHPKDEFELLHEKEKSETKKLKEAKKSKSEKNTTKVATVKQEKEKVTKTETPPINLEPPKEQRKGKNKTNVTAVTEDKSHEEATSAVAVSQPNDLTTDKILKHTYPLEIQNVANNASVNTQAKQTVSQVNAIQQRQPKKKKNELAQYQQLLSCPEGMNINILVQLLGDAPLSRSEIQILTDCLLNKQNGPLPEHSEWSEGPKDPLQKLKKQLAEKEKALSDEQEATQAVQAKLKELKNTLNAERARCSQISHGAEETANILRGENAALQTRIQRGIDENKTMRQQIHQLQAKVTAETEWNSQRTQLEKHIQSISEKNVALNSNITSLQAEIAEIREAHNASSNEALAAREHIMRLEEYRQLYDQSEIQKESLMQSEKKLLQDLQSAEENIKSLVEVKSEMQKIKLKSYQDNIRYELQKEEVDKRNQLLTAELTKLTLDKDELNKVIVDLKEKLATQPTSNGTTSPDKDDKVSTEKAVAAACRELEERHSQQIENLQNQLDQCRDKNNDLRTKNWKVMEALQAAEKKLQQNNAQKAPDDSSIREAILKACLEEQNNSKKILERLFPEITVVQNNYQEWTNSFVQLANKQKSDNIVSTETLVEKNEKMQAENEKLQLTVDNYQKLFGVLDATLSNLEVGAAKVDNKWKKELSEKQQELDDLKQITITNMKKEIESLQSALDNERKRENEFNLEEFNPIQTSKTIASAGMADVERLLEENTRLRETVERLQISSQSLNGPSQFFPITEIKSSKKRRSISGWLRRKITFRRKKSKDVCGVDKRKDPIAVGSQRSVVSEIDKSSDKLKT